MPSPNRAWPCSPGSSRASGPFRSISPSCAPSSNSGKCWPETGSWPGNWRPWRRNTTPSSKWSSTPSAGLPPHPLPPLAGSGFTGETPTVPTGDRSRFRFTFHSRCAKKLLMKNSTSYRLAFFMDPLPGILPDKDTTFALMLEAQKRGHQVLYFTPAEMRIQAGRPWAALQEVEVFRPKRPGQPHFRPAGQSEEPLAKADMVLMRVDPPVPIENGLLTQFLDLIPP